MPVYYSLIHRLVRHAGVQLAGACGAGAATREPVQDSPYTLRSGAAAGGRAAGDAAEAGQASITLPTP